MNKKTRYQSRTKVYQIKPGQIRSMYQLHFLVSEQTELHKTRVFGLDVTTPASPDNTRLGKTRLYGTEPGKTK